MPIHEHVRTILVKKTCLPHSLPPAHSADDKHQSYACSHCSKLFSSPSHLSRHTLIHTGEKPCLCSECGQQFSQVSSLERHQRTRHVLGKTVHPSTHRSYQCTLCHEHFSLKHNLKMHERKLHQIPTNFFCNLCAAYFTCKSSLQKHRNFRHRSAIRHPPTTISHTPSVTSAHHMPDNWTLIPNEQVRGISLSSKNKH